ncbi:hypothetical protein B0H19DRAFT_910511, partial [Mycena capillaripes]
LTSNDIPLDSEIPSICAFISDGQKQLDAFDIQIADLQTALAQLVRRRGETARRVRQYSAILSPVRRMPAELVCEIFVWTLPEDNAAKPPWHLGHICQSWRRWLLSYPTFW